ncbi:MAG TPA: response regulator, partial [Gemmata sp.]
MAPLTTGGGPLRVLVVDDDTDTVESTIDLLALHGFAVSGACDGDTALRLVLAGRPDVVLTDLLMPGRSGCALARQIRTVGIIPCPVLIAVTGCHGAALQEAST